MYFPYLRCKQFELLALKEIVPLLKQPLISPVLEPVKQSTGSLERTLDAMIEGDINFSLILNPIYGEFSGDAAGLVEMMNLKLRDYANFQFGIIINPHTNLDYVDSLLHDLNFKRPFSLVHDTRVNNIDALREWCDGKDVKYNLIGENFQSRRYRGIVAAGTKVLLEDRFTPQVKNADYQHHSDEFFSDDLVFYAEEGHNGFGDYLTIGNDYVESGRLPYAVAIHLTYENQNKEIWVRHFVSDSNSDNTDVAGKFGEALEKLIAFIDERDIQTLAANEFRELHEKSHYPGLGSLKKLSIMNHIQLVYELLKRSHHDLL